MNDAPLPLLFGILAALVLFSGFFSSSETGMMSLNRYRLRHQKKTGHKGALRAAKLLDEPDSLISMILIGNNLVNIFASAIATVIGLRLMGDSGIAIATLILTFVILIFAEIVPKTIAAYHSEAIAFRFSHVLLPLRWLMRPVIWLISNFTSILLRLLRVESKAEEALTMEELRTIVSETGHMIPKRHQGMLMNILNLEDVSVDDIMIPRNEVIGVDLDEGAETIFEKLKLTEYTRIPVFREDINNVIGVLHQRHVKRALDEKGNLDYQLLESEIQPPYFIPEGTPLHTQLFNMQRLKHRMGIVVDEYGVMQGIVTLEDILEEIVGSFTSDLDDNNPDIIRQGDDSFLIHGTTTIRDINKALRWELPTDGPKTLNGLLLEELESFPEAMVGVRVGNYRFEILSVEDNLIQQAKANRIA